MAKLLTGGECGAPDFVLGSIALQARSGTELGRSRYRDSAEIGRSRFPRDDSVRTIAGAKKRSDGLCST